MSETARIREAARALREMFYAALDMHELGRARRGARRRSGPGRGGRVRAYLQAARHQEQRRRIPKDKARPAWFAKSGDLFDDGDPF